MGPMFVRRKPNKSGSVGVQVIDKSNHGYRVVRTVRSARDPEQVNRLVALGEQFIRRQSRQYDLFPEDQRDNAAVLDFIQALANASIRMLGPEIIFGRLFDEIGFNAIPEPLFRDIVVARLVYPTSKLKTVDYLYRYQGKTVSPDSIYLFLDRLNKHYSQQAQAIAYRYSRKILKRISVVFYDVTSLYFEAEDEDDLRKIGFSKDGKFQNPQIMLGLLVGQNGYPIGYDIFEGNTVEGKTLIPLLEGIERRYHFGKPVVVADAAMLSKDNLDALDAAKYPFIVAARLRNETQAVQAEILGRSAALTNGQSVVIDQPAGRRRIVSYSDSRAKKDAHNRDRGLGRLRASAFRKTDEGAPEQLRLQPIPEASGEVKVQIDESQIEQAARWDGLKGYLTKTDLPAEAVIKVYGQLWHIEKAFRISKTDLRIRPIFHRRRGRIEAHVLVAFVAYTIYKELERRLHEAGMTINPSAQRMTQTMYEMAFTLPDDPRFAGFSFEWMPNSSSSTT